MERRSNDEKNNRCGRGFDPAHRRQPLFLLIYGLIRWKIGAPVVFRQERPGLYGQPFMLYKFRTMTEERDEHGVLLPDHLRLTKTGAFIRKLSLDELPQLVNVLKGEISLVGPRPLLMEYLQMYTEEQAKRHLVKPGITGWAQVNGRNLSLGRRNSPMTSGM